ncbi:helix-turn-helix domain-containing protein, partial [Vibrio parahaemolyticus]|nr:helix-turn-helix domain-containing protein [Vibrio parahaemolyticus]
IKVLPNPRRRHARIADNKYRYTDVAQLTDPMLQTLEMGTVIQAVGRVRPFTSPCEVITFQNNPHPNYQYDAEFNNLAEIREHFGIDSQRARTTGTKKQEIQQLKQQSLTQKQVAEQLGIGVRTVRRYWSGQKS